ncbi:MAG: extracellular solute-binding protein [Actinomycetota bacterium]|nr:extracellular solute-binding protein [Actinomycetota bacterium]
MNVKRWRFGTVAVVVLLLAAGCGGSPTAGPQPEEGASDAVEAKEPPRSAAAPLDEIYAQVDGKTLEERREILIPIAEEAGQINLYGSMNGDEGGAMLDAFEDATGLEAAFYRASAGTILQRILQEHDADFRGLDAVFMNGTEMVVLDDEGLLLPLKTPSTDQHPEEGVLDNWAWNYINAMVPVWNTEQITADRAPTSWEEVLTNYDGELVMEIGDFDWFATLVKWFQEEQGMSEEEAVELFRTAAAGASSADGHTLMTELVAAGEFGIAASAYDQNARQLRLEDAPVTYDPVVEPAIVRPNGIGIYSEAQNPAGALLWIDFMLSKEGQQILDDYERTPASRAIPEAGLPADVEILPVPLQEVFAERDKWSSLYEEIIQQTGPTRS